MVEMNPEIARNVVGIIGNIISFGLFLSPIPTFHWIIKTKSSKGFRPHPYLATVLNCLLWMFYAMPFVHPDSLLVLTVNSVGLVFEAIYVAIYFIYAENYGRKKVGYFLAGEFLFTSIVILVALFVFHSTKKRSIFVGVICDITNTIMACSPLVVMHKVIRTKSVKFMPFSVSLASFLNGCIWTAYALIKFDIFVLVSNVIGTIFGVVQLILYAMYYRSTPIDDNCVEGSKPGDLQLPTTNTATTETA